MFGEDAHNFTHGKINNQLVWNEVRRDRIPISAPNDVLKDKHTVKIKITIKMPTQCVCYKKEYWYISCLNAEIQPKRTLV